MVLYVYKKQPFWGTEEKLNWKTTKLFSAKQKC